MNQYSQSGAVLMYVLLFLSILSMLGFDAMNSALTQAKMAQAYFGQVKTLAIAEASLKLVEKNLAQKCIKPLQAPNHYADKFSRRDYSNSCNGQWHDGTYHYVIEVLQALPCRYISTKQDTKRILGVTAYRVTLTALHPNNTSLSTLQSYYLVKNKNAVTIDTRDWANHEKVRACDTLHLVQGGRVGWNQYR